MSKIKIAPSLLSADFSRLGEEIKAVEKAGADMLHIDIMDGHFVPNLTMGPAVVKSIRPVTSLPLDVHLMVRHPDQMVKLFADAGADIITVHVESASDITRTLEMIRDAGKSPGIVLNPPTPFSKAGPFLQYADVLLVMTVNPGFSGQKFMPEMLPKCEEAKRTIEERGLDVRIQIDGGINMETAPLAIKAGAGILVAGNAVFKGEGGYGEKIRGIRGE